MKRVPEIPSVIELKIVIKAGFGVAVAAIVVGALISSIFLLQSGIGNQNLVSLQIFTSCGKSENAKN